MASLLALVAVLLAAVSPAAAGALPLRVVSDVVECPSPAEVQSALAQVLGEGERTGGWTLRYGRDPAAPAASLVMELAAPAGERLTTRRIPIAAGDCEGIGTAMAAVVERSLRDLGWTRGEPLPEGTGVAKPVEATPAVTTVPAPAEARRTVPRLVLGAGPLLATSPRLGVNLLLEARARVAGPLCLRVGATALAGHANESVEPGRVSLSRHAFSLAALAASFAGRVELAGGPVALLAVDEASSSELPRVGHGTRAVLAVGAGIGVAVPLSRRWRVGMGLDGARVVFAPDTYVDGDGPRTTVLAPSSWQGTVAAKLEFVPWP